MKKSALILLFAGSFLSMALAPGEAAPEISAKNQEGKLIHLSDYRGKFVLLYFYPKDDTPGCTKEACSFRDETAKIKSLNTVVLGVSRQDEKSHREFRAKYHIPFDLLVDADGAVSKAYGVGTMPGIGLTRRQSILIGPDGRVIHFYESVDPAHHTQEVLTDIEKAGKG
ncbi:MAG: peroxiredoxin [Bdellovibrionota bacterium]